MKLDYIVRPISDRKAFTGPPAKGDRTPFGASWATTERQLLDELALLDAVDVVLEVDVREQDINVRGGLKATARSLSPGVRLAFGSAHGPLVYATDRYGWSYDDRHGQPRTFYPNGWQQNIRAIALGMEALRKVDRYGISRAGEQYRGYLAIESGRTDTSGMTVDLAIEIIGRESGSNSACTAGGLAVIARAARGNAHPDRNNGDRSRWDAVEQAVQVLTRAGRL